jgi:protein ImuB
MSKLYACIISTEAKADKEKLLAVARQFSYSIETLDDGVLFDVSGLERLVGNAGRVAQNILGQLKIKEISGNIAVAATVDTAMLLARENKGLNHTVASPAEFQKLPLESLEIENDSIGIFNELGITNVEELRKIPVDDLIDRYGQSFQKVIDVIQQKGTSFLTPNVKENNVAWKYELDFHVEDFEQLIFIVNHGLDASFGEVAFHGFSTEWLDITFTLNNKTTRSYEIKTSFPTLEKAFWLKLINLRVSLDPPEAGILAVSVTSHFTKPRPDQKGLYAVSRPTPESLLLTANKLKKLVGEENVGIPVLLDQRLAEPFALDPDKLPEVRTGSDSDWVPISAQEPPSIIALNYFRPPLPAEVLVRDGRLVFIRTRHFSGYVTEYSGVWKQNSKWWDKPWKTQEWDIEVEDHGVYRLCKANQEWFLTGEYD